MHQRENGKIQVKKSKGEKSPKGVERIAKFLDIVGGFFFLNQQDNRS